ncbi:MAG: NAD(P)H-binding protein [Chloroflexi bacterium]|nr:NAD(P)H-binding protein [Chloroflexota bacterium]
MSSQELHIVTGAFGYIGKYITTRLLKGEHLVRTLTNSVHRANPFGGMVEANPFNFDAPDKLVESLRGATVLYNTYWVRFNYKTDFKHSMAVENTLKLIQAAKQAGIQRFVHVSITNPSADSRLEYFSGKAKLERALIESGLSYAILRPTVVFGREDVLINNVAWILRHLPVFGVFGDGQYKLQPIYVDDLAALAVAQGANRENLIIDAIGPETFAYRELVSQIGEIIGVRRLIISVPPWFGYVVGSAISRLQGDVFITREEIDGLMHGLLCTNSPPAGETRLTDWARVNSATLGVKYASELARRQNRKTAYENL